MSPENPGVLQLLKEMTFRRILEFYNSGKWGHFGASMRGPVRCDWLVGLVRGISENEKCDDIVPDRSFRLPAIWQPVLLWNKR